MIEIKLGEYKFKIPKDCITSEIIVENGYVKVKLEDSNAYNLYHLEGYLLTESVIESKVITTKEGSFLQYKKSNNKAGIIGLAAGHPYLREAEYDSISTLTAPNSGDVLCTIAKNGGNETTVLNKKGDKIADGIPNLGEIITCDFDYIVFNEIVDKEKNEKFFIRIYSFDGNLNIRLPKQKVAFENLKNFLDRIIDWALLIDG